MSEDKIKDFLENYPPHKCMKLTKELAVFFDDNIRPINLELYCIVCKKEKTFNLKSNKNGNQYYSTSSYSIEYNFFVDDEKIKEKTLALFLVYACAQCGEKYYFTICFSHNCIKKIGQHPSFAKLTNQNIDKYKNILLKYYIEYKQSLSAYSQGMGVAAFVYLRRILEHLVESKYANLKDQPEKARFIDKLKAVDKAENIIPEGLEEVKNAIYTVLSKGVHEYSEEECLELYAPVNFIIELILDKQLAEKERENKIKNHKATILAKAKESNDTTK